MAGNKPGIRGDPTLTTALLDAVRRARSRFEAVPRNFGCGPTAPSPHELIHAGRFLATLRQRPAAVAAIEIEVPEGEDFGFTVSIGLAEADVANLDSLVRRADEALYEAKSGGRNRVALAPATA